MCIIFHASLDLPSVPARRERKRERDGDGGKKGKNLHGVPFQCSYSRFRTSGKSVISDVRYFLCAARFLQPRGLSTSILSAERRFALSLSLSLLNPDAFLIISETRACLIHLRSLSPRPRFARIQPRHATRAIARFTG